MILDRRLTAALICICFAPPVVLAQPQADPMMAFKEAGASADQQKQIRQLSDAYQKKVVSAKNEIQKQMKKLQDLSLQPLPDQKAMESAQGEINKVWAQVGEDKIHLIMDTRRVLNEDQRKKLVQVLKSHNGQPQ